MGREVRRVPANWEHPRKDDGSFQSLYDESYGHAVAKWKAEFLQWENKTHPDYTDEYEYWEWAGDPPDRSSFRDVDWSEEEATHYQLYENVSEGTPLSPPFSTQEDLAKWLSEYGDYWYQREQKEGNPFDPPHRAKPTYEQALSLVKSGHAFSMLIVPNKGILDPYEMQDELNKKP